MIITQPFFDNYLSHSHIMFLFSIFIVLVFVSNTFFFLYKIIVVPKIVNKIVVQIIQLFTFIKTYKIEYSGIRRHYISAT